MVEPVSDYLFIISLRKLRTGAHSIALFTAFSANDSEDFFFTHMIIMAIYLAIKLKRISYFLRKEYRLNQNLWECVRRLYFNTLNNFFLTLILSIAKINIFISTADVLQTDVT